MRNRKIIVTQWEVTQRSNDVYGNAEPRDTPRKPIEELVVYI